MISYAYFLFEEIEFRIWSKLTITNLLFLNGVPDNLINIHIVIRNGELHFLKITKLLQCKIKYYTL